MFMLAIGHSLSTMDRETQERMGRKFELCYVMAKESIPFAKYPALLELEECHAADIGHAYRTPDSAKSFTGFIAKSQHQGFLNSLSCGSRFFCLLLDGATDAGNVEDELIAILYCMRDDATQQINKTPVAAFCPSTALPKQMLVGYCSVSVNPCNFFP